MHAENKSKYIISVFVVSNAEVSKDSLLANVLLKKSCYGVETVSLMLSDLKEKMLFPKKEVEGEKIL